MQNLRTLFQNKYKVPSLFAGVRRGQSGGGEARVRALLGRQESDVQFARVESQGRELFTRWHQLKVFENL
jgi:hypothetical protein